MDERLLDPAFPHAGVVRAVRDSWRAHGHAEFTLSLALRRLLRDHVHRGHGYSRFDDYAEQEFGIPAKLAWVFSSMGEHLERLPRTREAVRTGELGYTKVREFMRIATPEDETRWIEYARTHTNREIEARVSRANDERAGKEHRERKEVKSKLTPEEVQAARQVREDLLRKTGRVVPEAELLGTLATAAAENGLFAASGSGSGSESKSDTPPPPNRPSKPYVTISLCPSCADTWVPVAGLDMSVRVEEWLATLRGGGEFVNLLEGQLCDCADVKHRRDRCPRPRPRREAAARNRHVPAAVRRLIEARDGHRYRFPGCTCPGPLEFSHLERFADGAPTTPETVVQHCRAHNRMLETGRVRVEGRAPFEQYYREDGMFVGVGGDPRPWGATVSHVGNGGESREESRKPPRSGRRRPA